MCIGIEPLPLPWLQTQCGAAAGRSTRRERRPCSASSPARGDAARLRQRKGQPVGKGALLRERLALPVHSPATLLHCLWLWAERGCSPLLPQVTQGSWQLRAMPQEAKGPGQGLGVVLAQGPTAAATPWQTGCPSATDLLG